MLANLGWVVGLDRSKRHVLNKKARENSQVQLVKLSSLNQCAIVEKYKIMRWRATMAWIFYKALSEAVGERIWSDTQ